ncbi:MAG: hypothetical protein K9M07_05955 [Simkaniaceae bacterium]|nr:hypothetical protein [Simkaniaceae bacterium]
MGVTINPSHSHFEELTRAFREHKASFPETIRTKIQETIPESFEIQKDAGEIDIRWNIDTKQRFSTASLKSKGRVTADSLKPIDELARRILRAPASASASTFVQGEKRVVKCRIAELEAQIASMRAEATRESATRMRSSAEEAVHLGKAYASNLEKKLKAVETSSKQEIRTLTHENGVKIRALTEQLATETQRANALDQRVATLLIKVDQLETASTDQNAVMSQARGRIQALQDEITGLNEALAKAEGEAEGATKGVEAAIEREKAKLHAEVTALKAALSEVETSCSDLSEQLEAKRGELTTTQEELGSAQELIGALREEKTALLSACAELEKTIATQDATLSRYAAQFSALEEKMKPLEGVIDLSTATARENDRLKAQNRELEGRIAALQAELASAHSLTSDAEAELSQLKKNIGNPDLEAKFEGLKSWNGSLGTLFGTGDVENLEKVVTSMINALTAENNELKRQLSEMRLPRSSSEGGEE